MARSLSQALARHLAPISRTTHPTIAGARAARRHRSNSPESESDTLAGKSIEEVEMEKVALKKLEETVHRIIVKKAQPNWLPLVPGASYWVPPKSKARGFVEVVAKLANESKKEKEERLLSSLSSNRGWPSSAHYFKGASHSPLEGETISKHTPQSEDEEA